MLFKLQAYVVKGVGVDVLCVKAKTESAIVQCSQTCGTNYAKCVARDIARCVA